MLLLKYRKRFIEHILSKKIIIERRKKTDIIQDLVTNKYPELAMSLSGKPSYDYLTNLPLFSLTQEKIDEFIKEFEEKAEELELYTNTTIQDLWLSELDILENSYSKWFKNFEELVGLEDIKKDKTKKVNKSTKNLKQDKDIKEVNETKSKISVQTEESKAKAKTKTKK
jgi:hypothetical protein